MADNCLKRDVPRFRKGRDLAVRYDTAFMDARCPCGRKIGWYGLVTDRPPCPACGHQPPQADLERAQETMDRETEMDREAEADRSTAGELRKRWKPAPPELCKGLRAAVEAFSSEADDEPDDAQEGAEPNP